MLRAILTLLIATLALGPALPWRAAAEVTDQPIETAQPADGQGAPQSPADAEHERLAREASKAYVDGDHARAIELFNEAYAVKPNPNILYNIAHIHEEQGEIEEAVAYYERFVTAPRGDLQYRREALERVKVLKEILALQEDPDQTPPETIPDDDGPVELAPVGTDGGTGGEGGSGGQVTRNDPPPPPPPQGLTGGEIAGLALLGTGGAALLAGSIFGALALSSHTEFEDAQSLTERRDAADSVETMALTSDILLFGGGALAATGLILWLVSGDDALEAAPTEGGVSFVPHVSAQQVGGGLTWTF